MNDHMLAPSEQNWKCPSLWLSANRELLNMLQVYVASQCLEAKFSTFSELKTQMNANTAVHCYLTLAVKT